MIGWPFCWEGAVDDVEHGLFALAGDNVVHILGDDIGQGRSVRPPGDDDGGLMMERAMCMIARLR